MKATKYQVGLQRLAISKAETLDYDVFEELLTPENQLLALPKLRSSFTPQWYVRWYLGRHALSQSVLDAIPK